LKIKLLFFLLFANFVLAQTKAGGTVTDEQNNPISYATVAFKNSAEGLITDENGKFYLESKKSYNTLVVSFVGFKTKEVTLTSNVNYDLKIQLAAANEISAVKIYSGKTSKKNNPALDILRKIWARKKKNGLNMFKQYEYDKYEKVEFDINSIDSAFMKSKIFKGMEFIFKSIDTSSITGKNYLPIFINENLSKVYGDNTKKRVKEKMIANKYSGFNQANNDGVNTFIKDLYVDYNIYDNYLKFFEKDFVSPLSTTGINNYNYVLADSSFIDKKWCYKIVYYPRRKNELTFKGDFWVNDSTFAIKSINLEASRSANINWVRDIYIEQEFDVLNDSVFLLKRDYMMTDFALTKKEKSNGMYGKRTTISKDHKFNKPIDEKVFKDEINNFDTEAFTKSEEFWDENRFETLNKNEKGIYKMLDTLKKVPKFKSYYNLVSILGSGYVNVKGIDFGHILNTIGYNDVEGLRFRLGFRTFGKPNEIWRVQGYGAYGFKDNVFKYGINAKYMIDRENRSIISFGNRRDVEQIGASLTTSNDVLGRSFASNAIFASGASNKLTNVNLTTLGFEMEPYKNLTLSANLTYRTLESASRDFKLDYYTDDTRTTTSGKVKQSEFNFQVDFTPGRKMVGNGVERIQVDKNFPRVFLSFTKGAKGVLNSDFTYQKLQFFYRQPILVGGYGRLFTTFEVGKTFGTLPLGLVNVIPGNQSFFIIENTYNLLNFYDLVADQYSSLHLEHNFNGNLFSRIPYFRDLNWREIVGIKAVYGSISQDNININASGLKYVAPTNGYIEYHAGIGNIFKVMRIDAAWRAKYDQLPNSKQFTIKLGFGFFF
jgi:hypothetical protein